MNSRKRKRNKKSIEDYVPLSLLSEPNLNIISSPEPPSENKETNKFIKDLTKKQSTTDKLLDDAAIHIVNSHLDGFALPGVSGLNSDIILVLQLVFTKKHLPPVIDKLESSSLEDPESTSKEGRLTNCIYMMRVTAKAYTDIANLPWENERLITQIIEAIGRKIERKRSELQAKQFIENEGKEPTENESEAIKNFTKILLDRSSDRNDMLFCKIMIRDGCNTFDELLDSRPEVKSFFEFKVQEDPEFDEYFRSEIEKALQSDEIKIFRAHHRIGMEHPNDPERTFIEGVACSAFTANINMIQAVEEYKVYLKQMAEQIDVPFDETKLIVEGNKFIKRLQEELEKE